MLKTKSEEKKNLISITIIKIDLKISRHNIFAFIAKTQNDTRVFMKIKSKKKIFF